MYNGKVNKIQAIQSLNLIYMQKGKQYFLKILIKYNPVIKNPVAKMKLMQLKQTQKGMSKPRGIKLEIDFTNYLISMILFK